MWWNNLQKRQDIPNAYNNNTPKEEVYWESL